MMANMPTPRIVGLILAGGRSTRMGGHDKALQPLRGRTLLEHLIRRLKPQVDALILNSNADPATFAAYGLPVVADRLGGFRGPMAGIHAALANQPDSFVMAVAVDLPLVPPDLVARLNTAPADRACAYASDGTRHAPALLFRPGTALVVQAFLERGGRSLKEFLAAHGRPVVFDRPQDRGLFMSLNTPEELARAEREYSLE